MLFFRQFKRLVGWQAKSERINILYPNVALPQMNLAIAILMVIVGKARDISCERRVLTRITAVELIDRLGIPVFCKSMVTIKMHCVNFAVVVSLNHMFSIKSILSVPFVNILHKDRRRIWLV